MTHLSGHDRSQLLLLSEAVDDYVGPDNPVRFIDAFVDGLDLAAASFIHVEPKVTGRPGYAPADLLKLYISAAAVGRLSPECVDALGSMKVAEPRSVPGSLAHYGLVGVSGTTAGTPSGLMFRRRRQASLQLTER
jgi:hypothetical protein